MKKAVFACLMMALVGCRKAEVPKPAEKPARTHGTEVASAPGMEEESSPSHSPKTTAKIHQRSQPRHPPKEITPQEAATQLQNAVGRYSITVSETDRTTLVEEMGDLSDSVGRKDQVAQALATVFRMENSPSVRAEIMSQLGWLEDASAVEPIRMGLDSHQPTEVQEAATEAMVNLLEDLVIAEDPAAFDQCLRGLQADLPQDVRLAAIQGLEDLEDKRAIAALTPFLTDNDPEVREAATDAVAWLTDN